MRQELDASQCIIELMSVVHETHARPESRNRQEIKVVNLQALPHVVSRKVFRGNAFLQKPNDRFQDLPLFGGPLELAPY